MGCVANGNCVGPVRSEHTNQGATPDPQAAQNSCMLKNKSPEGLARDAFISIAKDCRLFGAL
jgi:hypothetical protein